MEPEEIIVMDVLYGKIIVPLPCKVFFKSKEFRRLRYVKMGPAVHLVYPGAINNTRFEHCIGVMHLSGLMVNALRSHGADIDERTGHLIQLGGLMHDVGHYAFSHLFDKFLRSIHVAYGTGVIPPNHEDRSVDILRQISEKYPGVLTPDELEFVGNVITGNVPQKDREAQKSYLYEIVCNVRTGIDVDKMDYLRRDSYHTSVGTDVTNPGSLCVYDINNVPDTARIIADARCLNGHIVFDKNVRNDIDSLFRYREFMHREVYNHPVVLTMEKIFFCAMLRIVLIDKLNLNVRSDEELMIQLENYVLHAHDPNINCELCEHFNMLRFYHSSGSVHLATFV